MFLNNCDFFAISEQFVSSGLLLKTLIKFSSVNPTEDPLCILHMIENKFWILVEN